jgi:NAD(P)H dehydrogenase (quinone)
MEKLRQSDALILIFPLYFNNAPAILRGWFDRVLIPGPKGFFDVPNNIMYEKGVMKGKRAIAITVTEAKETDYHKEGLY